MVTRLLSKGVSPRNQSLSTYAEELLALVSEVNKWRPYLFGLQFKILTSEKFKILTRTEDWDPITAKSSMTSKWNINKGENKAADALSRKDAEQTLRTFRDQFLLA